MEFVANYNLDITYYPGKANLVADALSRKREDVMVGSGTDEPDEVERFVRLNALNRTDRPRGLEAANRANLLTQIRAAQDQDENLKTIARNDLTEYQIAKDGMILVHGRISIPNDRSLKDEILREAHKSRFSIHPGVTKMYHNLRQYYHWIRMKVDVVEWVASVLRVNSSRPNNKF